jgi:hypothetical protein
MLYNQLKATTWLKNRSYFQPFLKSIPTYLIPKQEPPKKGLNSPSMREWKGPSITPTSFSSWVTYTPISYTSL